MSKASSRRSKRLEANDEQLVIRTAQVKRKQALSIIKRLEKQINNEEEFLKWSRTHVSQILQKLTDAADEFLGCNFQLAYEGCVDEAQRQEDDKIDDEATILKSKLIERVEMLKPKEATVANDDSLLARQLQDGKFQIEVSHTDVSGNVPNTWGTFDGEYSKWRSFRDRWLAAIHTNDKVKTMVKFTNLKAACIKDAEGALGEWDLTEQNYLKAWNRLKAIYEDDYMQMQSFMQKLSKLPMMGDNSSKAIRDTIDTVQKHIHGVSEYMQVDEKHPYVVFAVIEKMDTDTYRAWEKYRRNLSKKMVEAEANAENEANPGKHIPTWKDLEQFLEGEVTIRVHAEKRNGNETKKHPNQSNASKNGKRSNKFFNKFSKNKNAANAPKCSVCPGMHHLYRCDVFKAMNLNGRKNHIKDNNLCIRCLRKEHSGRCERSENNDPCPRCKPDEKFHNSLICPNSEIYSRLAMLAKESNSQKKRKFQGKQKHPQAKKQRFNAENDSQKNAGEKTPAAIHKVSEWQLMPKQCNAIKQINKSHTNKNGESEYVTLIATLNINIQAGIKIAYNCRAIADTGSTLNCISKSFVKKNALPTSKCHVPVIGVCGAETITQKVTAYVTPWFKSNIIIATEFFVLNDLEGIYPQMHVKASKSDIIRLVLADEKFDIPAPIDALLSVNFYTEILGNDIYKHKDGAIMQSTKFGHIVLGRIKTDENLLSEFPILNISQNYESENERIEKALSKFWETEEINEANDKNMLSDEEKAVEKNYVETYYREASGRYVVTIPIKAECKLGESRSIALRQFLQLEKRLNNDRETKSKYIEYMRNYQNSGYMKAASNRYDPNYAYWIPHHAVKSKFRVVVNASAKTTSGESLNSIQMVGAKLQYDLQLHIMQFRKHKIGITTDISKMFNNIGLNPKQWDLQRIFWRESNKHPLKEYVLTVVMFGLTSSPFNAVRTLKQSAIDQGKKFPHAAEIIKKCFYMDDGIFGTENVQKAKILCKEIEFILNQANFSLKGWESNSKELELYMNKTINNETYELGSESKAKVLGLNWLKKSDELSIIVKPIQLPEKVTKLIILKHIAKLYDPNGFIAPIIVKMKMLMQDIWRLKQTKICNGKPQQINYDWNTEVPNEIKARFLEFYVNLPLLENFKLKRWLNTDANCSTQIHAFCDASEKAYGIVIYVRTVTVNGTINCSLLSAKSRIAPMKQLSIPRLELLGAVMLSEQLDAILNACELNANSITLWSDSCVVLHWINKQAYELKAFVSNRVKLIQEKTKHFTWKHVVTSDNPADLVSRGMNINDFLKSKFWSEGPKWLKQPEANWPQTKMVVSLEATNEIKKEVKDKEIKAKAFYIRTGPKNALLYTKFHDWDKIINITAYVLRYRHNLLKPQNRITGRYVWSHERLKAIKYWVKIEQENLFSEEIKALKNNQNLPKKCPIVSLRPMLDAEGLIRIGGRIDKANIAYDKRHLFIIPHRSHLSYLLLNYAHSSTLHGGIQAMTHFLRRQFWIPKLRQEAKHFICTCVQCTRQAQKITKQIMAELPKIRVTPAPPFQNVGVDMAGPYNMRITDKINMNTRARSLPDMKGWIAVFVCLVTRSVHLEPTEGLSTDDFLQAYQRFVSRRGHPVNIHSDNGTNFTGADGELKRTFQIWESEKIQHFVHAQNTKWHFITPAAPHEGGIWEAAVKSMKHHLRRIMGPQKYSLQGITTLLTSVEACLNSRPLCRLSDDPNDLEALTPAHFLIGRPLKLPINEEIEDKPTSMRRLFKNMQFQIQAFWKHWSQDYLQSLMQLPKWREAQKNLEIGQLVLVKCENIAPTYWAMGRIVKTQLGSDGKVRSVTLKTEIGMLERSVRKLCILPADIDLDYWKVSENFKH